MHSREICASLALPFQIRPCRRSTYATITALVCSSIHDSDHVEPWIIAMYRFALSKGPATPRYLKTMDCPARWAIKPMFSDFKLRGFGVEDTQIQHPDRLARLLVMTLAIYTAVSNGQWNAKANPTTAEKRYEASAEKARAVENFALYQRSTMHRPPYTQHRATAFPPDRKICCMLSFVNSQLTLLPGEWPQTTLLPSQNLCNGTRQPASCKGEAHGGMISIGNSELIGRTTRCQIKS
jgi:hypothetical protein